MAMTSRDLGLGSVRVLKEELLNKLKENHEKHLIDYADQMKGFQMESVKKLQKALREARKGKIENVTFDRPRCHAKDYQLVIEMLEMSVDEHIDLSNYEFKQYIQDQWDWTSTFNNTKMLYSQK